MSWRIRRQRFLLFDGGGQDGIALYPVISGLSCSRGGLYSRPCDFSREM